MEKVKERQPVLLEKYYSKVFNSELAFILLKVLAAATCALAQVFGRSSPLGLAIVAADLKTSMWTALGGAVGYIFLGTKGIPFAVACIAIGIVNRLVFQAFERSKKVFSILKILLSPILAGVATFCVFILPYLYSKPMIYDIILWGAALVLAVGFSIFAKAILVQLEKGSISGTSSLSLATLYCVCIMGLSAVQGFDLSLGRILGSVAILLSAGNAGVAISTLVGALTGIALGVSGSEATLVITAYTCYGMISSTFAPLGKLAAALSGCVVLAFFGAMPNSDVGRLGLEGVLAAAVFLAIPSARLRSLIHITRTTAPHSLSLITELKLKKAADGLRELSSISEELSDKLTEQNIFENADGIFDKLASNICRTCPLALNCWQTNFDVTVDSLNAAMTTLKRQGKICSDDLPKKFSYCTQKDEICAMMQGLYKRINTMKLKAVVSSRTRSLLNAQIDNLSSILSELSCSVASMELITSESLELEEVFLTHGLELVSLDELMVSGVHTIVAQVSAYRDGRYSLSALTDAVGAAVCKTFTLASAQQVGDVHIITLKEAPKIHLTYSVHQTAGEDGICGDSYAVFVSEGEKMYIMLSDGMGTGKGAALDSTFTVALLRRLVCAGLSIATAVELVNAELIVRKGNEATATVDVAEISLHTKSVTIFKGGANRSLIYRAGRLISMNSQSLPVGVLEKTFIDTTTQLLMPEDILIMFSDGVGMGDDSWVIAVIEQCGGESEETLAARLAKTARLRLSDDRPDDITVICAKVHSSLAS